MKIEDIDRLQDIVEHAREAVSFVQDRTEEEFLDDRLRTLGVTRLIEIIGEASNNLSKKFRSEHPEIPWGQITGMRHRIVHHYHGVSVRTVYQVVKEDLPELILTVERIVAAS